MSKTPSEYRKSYKNLIGFSLTHITPYNIIKANISLIKEVT